MYSVWKGEDEGDSESFMWMEVTRTESWLGLQQKGPCTHQPLPPALPAPAAAPSSPTAFAQVEPVWTLFGKGI